MQSLTRGASVLAAAFLLMAPSGCGGGSGNGSGNQNPGTGAEQTLTFGNLVTRVAGTVQPPVTIGSVGVSVTGAAGGLVSSLLINDANPTLVETRIAINLTGKFFLLEPGVPFTVPGGPPATSFNGLGGDFPEPLAWSPDGTKVAWGQGALGGPAGLWIANYDGTGSTRIVTTPAGFIDGFATWLSGAQIAFTRLKVATSTAQIYRVNADGTGLTNLSNNAFSDLHPAASLLIPGIVFTRRSSGTTKLCFMKTDGTQQAAISGSLAGDDFASVSPTSTLVAFSNGGKIFRQFVTGAGRLQLSFPPASAQDGFPSYAPDGSAIAFERDDPVKGVAQVWTMSDQGLLAVNASNNGWNDFAPSWSPFFPQRTLIGTGGSLGTAAAGFLFGRSGDEIKGVVTFDAGTRNGATVTPQTPPANSPTAGITGLPNVTWTIAADKLTALGFVNGTDAPVHIVTNSVPATNGAVVDFGSATGRVTDVIPYKADKAVGKGAPTVTVENGAHVVRGQLLGVWDATGVNHAPDGAAEVRLDGKTGAILAIR